MTVSFFLYDMGRAKHSAPIGTVERRVSISTRVSVGQLVGTSGGDLSAVTHRPTFVTNKSGRCVTLD